MSLYNEIRWSEWEYEMKKFGPREPPRSYKIRKWLPACFSLVSFVVAVVLILLSC